ncbi:hypothetical protein PI126_g18805 [Phytophthora idaei]|nr:hypothetical protein PI126_g18805 [Phytophthora idaei]
MDDAPPNRGTGSKYCVMRQWSLPLDQVKTIDDFFESHRKECHVRESISPNSSPTFCVINLVTDSSIGRQFGWDFIRKDVRVLAGGIIDEVTRLS